MAKQATVTELYLLVGDGDSSANSVQTINAAAAPPSFVTLGVGGATTVPVPSGYTLNLAKLKPPSGSANVKSVKPIAGDSNPGSWTSGTVTFPISGLTSFVIQSTSAETIEIWWY